jgi:hypothetical protein
MKTDSSKLSAADKRRSAIDALLDHALEETFPASDSMAVTIEAVTASDDTDKPKSRSKAGRH